MSGQGPETVIAIYRPRKERLDDFMELLGSHYPTLKGMGLVTDKEPVVYVGDEDQKGGGGSPVVFEIFEWIDGSAPGTAHHTPEVARIWEAMGTMVEGRDGKPKFEFPHVRRVQMAWKA